MISIKKITLALGFVFCTLGVSAQDIKTVFLAMPNNVLSSLNMEQKNVLLAHTDSASVTVKNLFGDNVKRFFISEDGLSFETSAAGTMQIRLLTLINNSKIICVIKTVCAKACDSDVEFYTTDWAILDNSSLFPNKDFHWFLKPNVDTSDDKYKNAVAMLDMDPVKLVFGKDNTIEAEYEIKNYLSKEDYKNVEAYLNEEPKVFTWNKISYK